MLFVCVLVWNSVKHLNIMYMFFTYYWNHDYFSALFKQKKIVTDFLKKIIG